jgi:acyl-CoA synthetase (AMP-forming)/AMP-acid ligase II
VLASTGIVRPYTPRALLRVASDLRSWGAGTAGGYVTLATRFPDEVGLVDDRGSLTFAEIHRRTNALAAGLGDLGVGPDDAVAVMCRNHRGFVEATAAVAKLGANVVYLNTAFARPQIAAVLAEHRPAALVHDEEFTDLVGSIDVLRIIAWYDGPLPFDVTTLDDLIARGSAREREPPVRMARTVILTSGTTGEPKGASRGSGSLDAAASLLSALPLRARWRTHIAAPMFHTWGWAHFQLGLLLGSTLVLARRFEPRECLEVTSAQVCESLVVVPTMLQRIIQLPREVRETFAMQSVRVVATSGSALSSDLALRWMDAFGDTLYNVYGSTECAWVSVATPVDLRAAPSTVGRPPLGTTVALYTADDRPTSPGEAGRIFVGNSMLFEGYTGGGTKKTLDGLMSTGDVGRFDSDGRLFVEGREDDMIISGGENIYPGEIEDWLSRHPDVVEAAVVGEADADLGQRVVAYVVLRDGARLDQNALKAHVGTHLARFKVPRDVHSIDKLPRNETGKVLKRELGS